MMKNCALLTAVLGLTAAAWAEKPAAPWPAEVEGFKPPAAGEHPRLLFRKADVPELRRRAATPEGKAMVARLRLLLGGDGETLPDRLNTNFPVNIGASGPKQLPVGSFTLSHAAGYGMLYQLTGDRKYADLSRKALELMFDEDLYSITYDKIKAARGNGWRYSGTGDLSQKVMRYGQPDRDERYTWTRPGARRRVGPKMAWVAAAPDRRVERVVDACLARRPRARTVLDLGGGPGRYARGFAARGLQVTLLDTPATVEHVARAYDLCYEAWDEEFRRRVVRELVDYSRTPVDYDMYNEGGKGPVTMDMLVNCSYPPTSNHFGSYIGGAGMALLAVRGDAGAEAKRVEPWLATIEKQAIRLMTQGFGDHGFFAEGHGPSHMSANPAFIPFLQAARVAWGKDFISPRPNGQWLTLRWVMEAVPDASGKAWYPNYHPSSYGPDFMARDGMSDGGEFCQGFGALASDDQRAALLWLWNRSYGKMAEPDFDAPIYPHRAVMALINWPIELAEKNPAEVLGRTAVDTLMGHYMFRKGFSGPDDIYFSFLLNPSGRHGYVRGPRGGNVAFYGLGHRMRFSAGLGGDRRQTFYEAQADGSGVLSFVAGGKTTSIAVDYSDKTGAEAAVIIANPWFDDSDRLRSQESKQAGTALTVHPRVRIGDVDLLVLTAQKGKPPQPSVDGDSLRIGQRRYRFDGQKLIPQ